MNNTFASSCYSRLSILCTDNLQSDLRAACDETQILSHAWGLANTRGHSCPCTLRVANPVSRYDLALFRVIYCQEFSVKLKISLFV